MTFLETIKAIQTATGLSDQEFCEATEVSLNVLLNYKSRRKDLSLNDLERILAFVSVSYDNFYKCRIDFDAIANRFRRAGSGIPSRYFQGAFSRKRTSTNVLSYAKRVLAPEQYLILLRSFQATPSDFENPDELVSITFLEDLTTKLHSMGMSENDFDLMGIESFLLNRGSAFKVESTTQKEVIEEFFGRPGLIKKFDENTDYLPVKIRSGYRIDVTASQKAASALKRKILGNVHTCRTKGVVLSTFSGYAGLPLMTFRKTGCVHQGDSRCSYEFDPLIYREELRPASIYLH